MAEQALLPPQGDGPTAGPDAPLASARAAQPNDLLSALLERGSKLREAMVMSSLRTELDCDATLKDTPLPLPKDNIRSTSLPPVMPSSGRLFHQLLNVEHSPPQRPHSPSNYDIPECTTDSENRAVDLLLGSINGSLLEAWDGEGSPPASLSAYSSVCLDSELNDPQYDESLLENLFYKAPKSDSSDHEGELENPGKGDDHKCTKQNRGPKDQPVPEERGTLASLSLDRVTSLGAMRLARVTIHSLAVPPEPTTPQKPGARGRPPRPLSSKRCTYFVEYVFPASPSSQTASAEVSRVASSKITGGVVKFLQRIVFPVHFSGAALEQWWQTELTFKIFSRKNTVKKPLFLGTAAFLLRSVLESEGLAHTASLAIQGSEGSTAKQEVGPLKVSVQLAEDSQDFTAKPKPSSRPILKRTRVSPHRSPSPSPLEPSTSRAQLTVPSSDRDPPGSQQGRTSSLRGPSPAPAPAPGAPAGVTFSHGAQLVNPSSGGSHQDVRSSQQHGPSEVDEVGGEGEEVLLHALLMVPDGKDLCCGPYLQPPNVYLNCKLFGSDEMARSVVSWGQTNPSFSFTQVAPVPLSHRLLERMKNNVLVIEVWQRAGPALQGQDQLLGLVKLPLHQFYMSFRDSRISQLLLQAQYPVIAVDSHTPIVDVFSGSVRGSLRVLLAMGLAQQIIALQRAREEEMYPASQAPRPSHLLDHVPAPPKETKVSVGVAEALTEHVFVVRVEKVRGLAPLQATVWGEADCYIQYSFPTQEDQAQQQADPDIVESSVTLKQFRTSTTLCVPDPLFGHSETHVLLVPPGVPVQKILLSSLSSQGLRNGGGIQFEVWCRYYYPNVRDQHVAKGLLLLPKLCGMVTLQRQLQQTEPQLFSLPLIPRTEGNTTHQPPPSGFLDVSIQYKHRPLRSAGPKGGLGAARFITLMVQIHRAAGLKAAARAVASADPSLRHFCEAGVNAYVSLQLSFLSDRERRVCTRVVASSFCPEFSHVLEVPCSLLSQREGAVTRSLAEQLHDAHAVFTVHHRDHRRGGSASRSKEAVLGTITIPLADLIHKRTGISGWFGLLLPQDVSSSQASHSSVGGLELSIGFAHHSDRDRMIKAARAVGWEPDERSEDDIEDGAAADDDDDNDDGGDRSRSVCVSVAVPRAWLPLHCLLQPEDGTLLRSTYCYFRYKLYDRDACCSDLRHPTLDKKPEAREGMDNYDQEDHDGGGDGDAKREDEGSTMTTVVFEGCSRVGLRCSQPLRWYLREERLEVQVWVAQGKGKGARPCDTDRLVGSAFVDLSTLATASTQKQTISGVYPLFRRSAADLSGAAVRVHVTMTPGPMLPGYESDPQAEQEEEEEEEEDWVTLAMAGTSRQIHKRRSGGSRSKSRERPPTSRSPEAGGEDSFGVTVSVDRAMHLSMKGCPLSERAAGVPGYCVSYATAGPAGTVSTHVVQNSSCPVWDHQLECRLSKQLLLDPQQSLVFKVWHKGDVERVIGFVTVDLSPLLSGFQSVCGWYNITDFSGQCQGQLKVAIAPLRGVHDLRRHRQTLTEEGAKDSSAVLSGLPLCYQTTGVYSAFPSHISRYPEQRINTPPHHLEHMLADRSSGRQEEHGVSHQCPLQGEGDQHQQQASQLAAGDADPSRSVLFSALRRNLSELDDIQRYFSRKLISPPFPSSTGRGDGGGGTPLQPQEERRDSDTDTQQLLLKSSRLVGQVNSIINGMSDCQGLLSNISGLPPRPTRETCLPAADHQAPSKVSLPPSRSKSPDTPPMLSPRDSRTPEVSHDPLLTSYEPVMTQHEHPVEAEVPQSDTREPALVEDEEDDDEVEECLSEEEMEEHDKPDEEHQVGQDEDDYEDDEDFEETLLEPRTLNEITSMTDRTSPWTSVVDDADLGSLDGLAEQEQEERPSCDLPMRRSSMEEEEMAEEDVEEEQEEESRVDIVESSWTKNTMPYTIKTLSVLDSDAEGSDGGAGGSDANDTLIESSSMQQRSEEQGHVSPPLPADLSSWTEGATAALTGSGCQEEEEESLVVPVSGEGNKSPKQHSTDDVEQEQESEKLCDVLDMPNFFLPTQHLEASMRALRLAPTFPLATTELETSQGIVVPRRTRPRPRFTPSAANREETKRIAKIFASHFKDDH
ncbi:C2 domain-containing protein 3 [Engraulis encrasicolus]|uniref:C2 domain-containing protein 3 n=1 Tax=Engraulis encrasicolus TaxID=184585 RepID=UPI002FD69D38